jgi:mannose-6-phosphate isomerase-like protein (cupin superfamily)
VVKIVSLADLPKRQVSHNPEIEKKVMLEAGDLPHVTNFSQATFGPDQAASLHTHADMYEVFFVEAGEGMIRVDGEAHPLEIGTCVVVAPGEEHELINTGATGLVLTYFGIAVGDQ